MTLIPPIIWCNFNHFLKLLFSLSTVYVRVYQFHFELFLMNQKSIDLEEIHFFKSHFEKSRFGRDSQIGNYLACYTNQRWSIPMKLYVLFTKIMNFECNSHEHNNHKSCDKLINTKVAYYILPTHARILLPSLQIFNM